DLLQQLPAGDGAARVADQIAEEVGFHQGEVDLLAQGFEAEVFEVDFATGEFELGDIVLRGGAAIGRVPLHAAQQAVEAGEQDGKVEGLGQVIVGSGGEALEDVFWASASSEHEQRNEVLRLAEFFRDLEAVPAGQHDVEEDGVKMLLVEQREGALAVSGDGRFIAFGAQIEEESLGEMSFVFDDE